MIPWLSDCILIGCIVTAIDRRFDWPRACLLSAALVVATAEALSPWGLLGRPAAWLGMHGSAAALAAVWLAVRRGRSTATVPGGRGPVVWIGDRLRRLRRLWSAGGIAWKAVFAGYGVLAVWAVAFPPSNWDSYNYHLTRVGFYLQQGSFDRYPALNAHEIEFPGNAETLALWTVAFLRHDRCVQLVQWAAAIAAAVSVSQTAVMLGASRQAARAGGLISLTLPEVIFQATSTQNDMCAAFCAIASLRYGLAAIRTGDRRDAVYAGLAAGLGFGTKGTYLFIGPGLAVYLLVEAWRISEGVRLPKLREVSARLLPLAGCVMIAVAGLGSRWIVDNSRAGDAGGGGTRQILTDPGEPLVGLSGMLRHGGRLLFDQSGFPTVEPAKYIRLAIRPVMKAVSGFLREARGMTEGGSWGLPVPYGMNEDTAYFGPLTLSWIAPGIAFACLRGPTRRALVPGTITFGLMAWLIYYTPWAGRLFCVPMFLTLPAVAAAWAYERERAPGVAKASGYAKFATVLALVVLVTCCVRHDGRRPEKWFGQDEAALRCAMRPALAPVCRWYLESPPAGRIGFFGGGTDWAYMTFLPDFDTPVVTGPADPALVADRLAASDLDRGTIKFADPAVPPPAVDGYRFSELTENGWWGFQRDAMIGRSRPHAIPTAAVARGTRSDDRAVR